MIKASNNPFPCEPNDKYPDMLARGGYTGTAKDLDNKINSALFPDDFIVIGEITKTENTISIQPLAFQWRIGQVLFENQDLFSTVITPATEGHNRIDIVVATDFGVFIKIQGIEGVDSAQEPPTPDNTLRVAFISVFGSEIATPTPPIIGDFKTIRHPNNLFKFVQKGFGNNDLQNDELGDVFCGWSDDGTLRYPEAKWLGGPLNTSASFKPLITIIIE